MSCGHSEDMLDEIQLSKLNKPCNCKGKFIGPIIDGKRYWGCPNGHTWYDDAPYKVRGSVTKVKE